MQDTRTSDERLAIVVGQLNAVHAQIVALVAEADATDPWAVSGIKSLPHWLTWQAGVSPATARQWVDTAAQLESHPATADLFTHGVLTLDQTAVAVQAPEHNDHEFAALAPLATVSQLRVMVRAASEPREPEPAGDQESCSHTFDENGRLHLRADLDPDRGQLLERALAEARDRLFQQGQQDLTWADALVEVCRSSLDGQAAHRRDRYRINLFLALDEPIPARWEGGLTVPDSLRRHVTATAPCRRCSRAAACRSPWGAPPASFPSGRGGWSCIATAGAASPGAARASDSNATTLTTGRIWGRPTPTT